MPLKEVNWDEFVFRSHYFGELMTPVRGKSNLERYNESVVAQTQIREKLLSAKSTPSDLQLLKLNDIEKKVKELILIKDIPTLSNTCKRRLAQIYTEETTGRIKDIESMYLEKGLLTEEDSITKYSQLYQKMYRKNKIRLNNGFVNGEWDFEDEEEDMIIDAKSTWDIFTFDEKRVKGMSFMNEWQGHCYMWLKNRKNFRVAFCLNDTPEEIIKKLIKRMEYNFIGEQQDWDSLVEELRKNHTYKDLPLERKVMVFDLKRSEEKIEMAKMYIPHFRNYLKNITNNKIEDYEQDSE